MRILQVIPALGASYGGPSIAMRAIVKSLIQQGVDVDVVTTNANGKKILDKPLNFRIEEEKAGYYFFQRRLSEWKFSWGLTTWLNQHISEYDLVHSHAIFCYPSLPAGLLARKNKIPYIIRPAGILDPWCLKQKAFKKNIYYRLLEKKNIMSASAIHVTSEIEKKSLALLNIEKNVFLIPHAVHDSKPVQRFFSEEMKILFLGRLHPKKGIELLLKSVFNLFKDNKKISLTIAGEGEEDYFSKLAKLANELGIQSIVHFVGFVQGEEKNKLIQAHHVFVLPSFQENFAVAAAESLASGMPVILTDHVGLSRNVKIYDAGCVIEVNNVKQLTEAIVMLNCQTVWENCSKNALKLAREQLTIDVLGKNLLNMYQQVLGEHGKNDFGDYSYV